MSSPEPVVLTRQQRRDLDRAAEAVASVLQQAIEATISEDSPEPARETILEIVQIGQAAPDPDGDNPAVMMTTVLLLSWLGVVGEALAEEPERVPRILEWVEEHLGHRCRLRAGYTASGLNGSAGVDEIADYARGLGADFMPSILWLLAGAVACYGDGDVSWLTAVQQTHADRS